MKLSFDPRLITEIIGKGNYTQFRSILAEYVANAWDAEASFVEIAVPDDFENEPIIIKDNGKGIQDLEQFCKVGSNVQLKRQVTEEFRRNVIGKKGIGRFAGFACAQEIVYESRSTSRTMVVRFSRAELLQHDQLDTVEIPIEIVEEPNTETGTTITINYLDGTYSIPSMTSIERDLLLDFGIISDFKIFLNGEELKASEIPGEIFLIEENNEAFGHIVGNIVVARSPSKKQKAGVIIRVKNRRVEGPDFFGVEDSFSSKILNRIYGDINADGLDDIISSGREAFIQHDQKYEALRTWIQTKIVEIATGIQETVDVRPDEIIFGLTSFKKRLSRLPAHMQTICVDYIRRISPKLNRIKNDQPMLELFGLLILRACENSDFFVVLNSLEQADNMDIATMAKALTRWGIGEIAQSALLVRNRITILGKFAEVIDNDKALELQDLHRILEYSTWILDDRYTLFSSNEGLRNIVTRLQQDYEGKNGRMRPDLILKRNRKDFVLVELKAPSVEITMVEVTQALQYKIEIAKYHPEAREMDVYLVGRQFDSVTLDQYFEGNPQRVHLLTLNAILQQAQDRLNWLTAQLSAEYEYVQGEAESVADFLPDLQAIR